MSFCGSWMEKKKEEEDRHEEDEEERAILCAQVHEDYAQRATVPEAKLFFKRGGGQPQKTQLFVWGEKKPNFEISNIYHILSP